MSDDKQNSAQARKHDDSKIDEKLGIETISFKCNGDLADKLKAMSAAADMELEPFIRRLCMDYITNAESPKTSKPPKRFDWGDLKTLSPASRDFGFSAGQPIDRFYIDQFLLKHCNDIHGCVLEIADNHYTKRFGGNRVDKSEILNVEKNEKATIVGNLESGEGIPCDTFDCIILTQTLPFIFGVQDVISHCFDALKSGGVLLCTVNGVSQISRYDMDRWGDFWRFTNQSVARLISKHFADNVQVETFGNVLSATSFLMGLPAQELQMKELNHRDDDYQVLIGARAVKKQEEFEDY